METNNPATTYRGFTITPDGPNLVVTRNDVVWTRTTNRATAIYIIDKICADMELMAGQVQDTQQPTTSECICKPVQGA